MARRDLYHFGSASVHFFHPAMEYVWQSLHTMEPLLRILDVSLPAPASGGIVRKVIEFQELG